MKLPPGITTVPNTPPDRATAVLKNGVRIGEYERRAGGYRWRNEKGAYGDAATTHLAIVALVEIHHKTTT